MPVLTTINFYELFVLSSDKECIKLEPSVLSTLKMIIMFLYFIIIFLFLYLYFIFLSEDIGKAVEELVTVITEQEIEHSFSNGNDNLGGGDGAGAGEDDDNPPQSSLVGKN